MESVVACAVAGELGKDRRVALLGVFEVLEDKDARRLGGDKAVAFRVERAAGLLGLFVVLRQRADDGEARETDLAQSRLGAAGDGDVDAARTDEVERVAYALSAGGAGGDHRVVVALGADVEGNVSGRHVRQHLRVVERVDLHAPSPVNHSNGFLRLDRGRRCRCR